MDESGRWTNPSQPQTLQIAVFLLYFDAVFALLSFSGLGFVIAAAAAAAGRGIASERKWGYWLGIAVTFLALYPYLLIATRLGPGVLFTNFRVLLGFMIAAAHFILLVHPMSRSYQKIWFK